jgi:class 3 adenylate cyclase
MLDDIFETLAAALRRHDGEVLKFLGDGMLACCLRRCDTR